MTNKSTALLAASLLGMTSVQFSGAEPRLAVIPDIAVPEIRDSLGASVAEIATANAAMDVLETKAHHRMAARQSMKTAEQARTSKLGR